ncbi:hypothetical protein [Candidatus Nitrotoga sp. HW29]|uniref:hypothetical protein n=1 Tax=Candidatus Nitrotoga sp. HW29 TaxID=2886963 RepID=UPI001EF2A0C1|nr:hypothetical protein [Candidatus Nitrotoga sp. HW29]
MPLLRFWAHGCAQSHPCFDAQYRFKHLAVMYAGIRTGVAGNKPGIALDRHSYKSSINDLAAFKFNVNPFKLLIKNTKTMHRSDVQPT